MTEARRLGKWHISMLLLLYIYMFIYVYPMILLYFLMYVNIEGTE
jgi:cell division septal protein FtsQ